MNSFEYVPVLADIVANRRCVGSSGRVFEGLEALSTTNNLVVLRNLTMARRPENTLEIGLAFGGSAMVLAASHRDNGRAGRGQHTALDPFQSQVWDCAGLRAIELAGLSPWLDFRQTHSARELPRLWERGEQFDLIYIDGSHLFEDVFVDLYYGIRLLRDGGTILLDDCTDRHVAKVVTFIRTNLLCLREIDLGQWRADSGRSARYRLGKAVGRLQLRGFERIGPVERKWDAILRRF